MVDIKLVVLACIWPIMWVTQLWFFAVYVRVNIHAVYETGLRILLLINGLDLW